MCLQLVRSQGLDWIAEGKVQWRAVVNFIIKFCFPRKARNFLTCRMIIIFTRSSFQKKFEGKFLPRRGIGVPEGNRNIALIFVYPRL